MMRAGWAALAFAATVVSPGPAAAEQERAGGLSRVERRAVEWIDAHREEAVELLRRTVDVNSGTRNVEGVRAVGEILRRELEALGFEARLVEQPADTGRGPHLVAERRGRRGRRVLLVGHLDTVFETDSPFQRFLRDGDRARGPGTVDMKGGNVIMVQALKALHAAGALDGAQVVAVFTGDEEDPGPIAVSRAGLVEIGRRSDVALGFEATAGGLGFATVARRGASEWRLKVTGQTAHSSGIFGARTGAGAVFEAARIVNAFYETLAAEANLTFNPALVLGATEVDYDPERLRGTAAGKTNIVAPTAVVHGDLRFLTEAQKESARERMRRIVAEGNRPRTSAEITFTDGYPAMEPRPGNYVLLEELDQASRHLGFGPVEAFDPGRRGAGDVSFVASSLDALDGLGAMGSGAHTAEETVDLASLPTLTKRAAVLIHRLTRGR